MRIIAIVPFLNEEQHLPVFLNSVSAQLRAPDELVLVDDGSTDASPEIARAFAARHPHATVLQRPARAREPDRLAGAPELRAWHWALEQLDDGWDVVAKLDADLRLPATFFATLERHFERDPTLGVAGTHLTVAGREGTARPERNLDDHVRGATKFYRRECYRQIAPLPEMLGWDTIDEVTARMHGWTTASFHVPGGDPVQLRRTGSHDGVLRGFRRRGLCAYAYGAHPLYVVLGALRRMTERPVVLAGVNYFAGWLLAGLRREPRAERSVRGFARREQADRMRSLGARVILGTVPRRSRRPANIRPR